MDPPWSGHCPTCPCKRGVIGLVDAGQEVNRQEGSLQMFTDSLQQLVGRKGTIDQSITNLGGGVEVWLPLVYASDTVEIPHPM